MNELGRGSLTTELLGALQAAHEQLEGGLEPLGLSLAKLGVLDKLAVAQEPLPLGTLADRLACVRSNITQLVDRLEAEKLVVRSDDPHDRRSILAELTSEGRKRHAAGMSALGQAERELVSRLPADQRDLLIPVLRSLRGER